MATLKISDLSVGDWMHHDFYEVDMRVKTIYGDTERIIAESDGGYGVTCHLDHFSPIPITPKILKANGFLHNGKRFYTPELSIILERGLDVWTIILDGIEYTYDVCIIKYVHQLQHALRLAVVDKEIAISNKQSYGNQNKVQHRR